MRKYDEEFKMNAVKRMFDGQSVASLSRELGVGQGLLHKWKQAKIKASSDGDKELIALKKKIRELEMENEILKKAAIIFGRGS
jgi:transposase